MRKVKTRKSVKKEDYEDLIYYKLKNSKFKQQRLPAWRPVPTIGSIIAFYFLFSTIFIGIGIMLIIFSEKIHEEEIPYNERCKDQIECEVQHTITKDMKPPIMIYYKLEGFFQNHRRYVRSKSQKQLFGDNTTLDGMKSDGNCEPVYTNSDMGLNENDTSIDGTLLAMDDVAVPCGLMAKTFFNDNFRNWSIGNVTFTPDEKNIAWKKDKELFKNPNPSKQWLDIEDEHFIVWMRPSGLPNFRKLWGRITDTELKNGEKLTFIVDNNYNVTHYSGDKIIILSITNEFGGKNKFLGFSFIVVGGISLLLGVAFPVLYYQRNKNENMKKKL